MDFETSRKIQSYLSSEERLIWSGKPGQGIIFRPSDALLIPFSLLWGGFAFFWEYSVYTSNAPVFFLLFGGIFVLIGVYFIIGRFLLDTFIRSKTCYGVTDNRVLIITEFPSLKIKTLNLPAISDITYTVRYRGIGNINFGPGSSMGPITIGIFLPGMEQYLPPRFELIDNARNVYEMIVDARKRSR